MKVGVKPEGKNGYRALHVLDIKGRQLFLEYREDKLYTVRRVDPGVSGLDDIVELMIRGEYETMSVMDWEFDDLYERTSSMEVLTANKDFRVSDVKSFVDLVKGKSNGNRNSKEIYADEQNQSSRRERERKCYGFG